MKCQYLNSWQMFQETRLITFKVLLDYNLHFHLCFYLYFYSTCIILWYHRFVFYLLELSIALKVWICDRLGVLERPSPPLKSNPVLSCPFPLPASLHIFHSSGISKDFTEASTNWMWTFWLSTNSWSGCCMRSEWSAG